MDCIKMVVTMNPCPCGYYPGPKCRCTDYEIIKYRGKISGPIMDRIDIQKSVHPVDFFGIDEKEPAMSSEQIRKRVEGAREIQQERYADEEGIRLQLWGQGGARRRQNIRR
ncbi:MAG: ATP-binding protein [Agathobacter sp.]